MNEPVVLISRHGGQRLTKTSTWRALMSTISRSERISLMTRGGRSVVAPLSAVLAAATLGGLVGGLGYAGRRTILPASRQSESPAIAVGPGTCTGGPERIASIEIVPDAVITEGSRRWVEYHSEVTIRKGASAGVAWDADVVDDRGNVILPHLASGQSAATSATPVVTTALTANALKDGFYVLRVRAAISTADEPSDVVEALQPAVVKDGTWSELTEIDWRAQSKAMLAFAAPQSGVR